MQPPALAFVPKMPADLHNQTSAATFSLRWVSELAVESCSSRQYENGGRKPGHASPCCIDASNQETLSSAGEPRLYPRHGRMEEKKDLAAEDEKALHEAIKDWKKNGSF